MVLRRTLVLENVAAILSKNPECRQLLEYVLQEREPSVNILTSPTLCRNAPSAASRSIGVHPPSRMLAFKLEA